MIRRFLLLAAILLVLPYPVWALDAPHNTRQCVDCHSFHGSSYPGLLGNGKLCLDACHVQGGPGDASGKGVVDHSSRNTDNSHGDWEVDCWACHDAHDQEQEQYWGITDGYFVRRYMQAQIKKINPADPGPYWSPVATTIVKNTDIQFSKSANSYTDGDGSATDDICRVCHKAYGAPLNFTAPSNFSTTGNTHTLGATVSPGVDCTSCHQHSGGFKASGGTCTGCHASTQPAGKNYRRDVASASGDFNNTSHHVGPGNIVTPEDCEVCHEQSSHQTWGNDPTTDAGYKVLLWNPDSTSNITYNGTGASIETFCLNCHDNNGSSARTAGATAMDPFKTGNNAPPNIKTTWVGSSHDNALTTEACLSCHGGADSTRTGATAVTYDQNAHGSTKVKLLSPKVANEDLSAFTFATTGTGASARTDMEELCYSCHDSNGPSSKNIEGKFKSATTNGYRATSNSGAPINQRHDVSGADQTYSTGVVECSNCHNPHMATSTNKNIDPDAPTTTYTRTYAKNLSYTRSGYNFSYQSATTNSDPMSPVGCASAPSSVFPAVQGVHNGDDLGTSGGTYTGVVNQTYTVRVSTGGTPGTGGSNAKITVTSTGGDPSGPTNVTAFDTPISVGTKGVNIKFTNGGTGPPSTRGPAVDPPPANDDTATSGGVYTGTADGTYTVTVTTGGRDRNAIVQCTGLGCGGGTTVCGSGGPQCAYGTAFAVGSNGVTITFTDTGAGNFTAGDYWTIAVTAAVRDGVLTLDDTWTIDANKAGSCSTAPELDMVTFCLVCHDGARPAGVTMHASLRNIATDYRDADQHGVVVGNNGGNGYMKAPWQTVAGTWASSEVGQPYAALQCTTCHDGHGSDNLFHLKTSLSVRGVLMKVGGGPGSGFQASPFNTGSDYSPGSTTYKLPCFIGGSQVSCTTPGSTQLDHKWGAWCTFCHDMQTHGQAEDNTCRTGHMHGGGAF